MDKKETEESDIGFYDYCYREAKTKEQKDALAELVNDKSLGLGEWKRETLAIIGQLPEGSRRITI